MFLVVSKVHNISFDMLNLKITFLGISDSSKIVRMNNTHWKKITEASFQDEPHDKIGNH